MMMDTGLTSQRRLIAKWRLLDINGNDIHGEWFKKYLEEPEYKYNKEIKWEKCPFTFNKEGKGTSTIGIFLEESK